MIIDSHCHLNFPQFSEILDEVVERAYQKNVKAMQTICTSMKEFESVLAIANRFENIFCSAGVHPNNVGNEDLITEETLLEKTKELKVTGIGETGLDYYYENSDRDLQKESFIRHISVSRKTGLPVIIHMRDAEKDTLDILSTEMAKGEFPALIHCFSSDKKFAESVLEMGLYISVSGIITFKKAEDLRNTVKDISLDKLLVETDAPYLAPTPYRGKTNEPAYTYYVAEKLSHLKGVSLDEVSKVTTNNFCSLFTKFKLSKEAKDFA